MSHKVAELTFFQFFDTVIGISEGLRQITLVSILAFTQFITQEISSRTKEAH